MDVKFSLVFPHEALSVPVMRRVLGDILRSVGADEDGVADLLLAVTEACTNVIRHGHEGPGRKYEVVASLVEGACMVEVLNGWRSDSHGLSRAWRPAWRSLPYPLKGHRWAMRKRMGPRPPADAQEIATLPESGRGMAIMRACVDDVTMSSGPGRGTVVSLQKRMEWHADAALAGPPAGQLRNVG